MGHIESNNPNPLYMIGSCCTYPGWSYLSQMRSGWNMDSYYDWKNYCCWNPYHKQKRKQTNKQTNKQTKRKRKQAYAMVDLNLGDS